MSERSERRAPRIGTRPIPTSGLQAARRGFGRRSNPQGPMSERSERSPVGTAKGAAGWQEGARPLSTFSLLQRKEDPDPSQTICWAPGHGRTMRDQAILRTLSELDRWKRRQEELRAELEKVERQVVYYEALAKDMKREVRPARLGDLLRTMWKL